MPIFRRPIQYNSIQKYFQMNSTIYEIENYSDSRHKRPYHRITQDQKNQLIRLVFQEKNSISKASKIVGVNNSTAKVVIRNYRKQFIVKTNKINKENTAQYLLSPIEHNSHSSNNISPQICMIYIYQPIYTQLCPTPISQTYSEHFLFSYSPLE